MLGVISDKLLDVGEEIIAPFKKLIHSVRSLFIVIKSSEDRGIKYTLERVRMFFKYGWLWNKRMIGRLLNYLLPIASLAVCAIVVVSMLSLNYVLKINYNGQTVGYVKDESVYDSARKIIQNRMVTGENKNWGLGATMSISVVDSGNIVSQDEMAEALLSVSGEEIVQATGLYVGGTFVGATAAGELLADTLDSMLAPQRQFAATIGGDITVKFARDVELVNGVYPSVSVMPFDELKSVIDANEADDVYYIAKGGELAADIALKNGISYERLVELNGPVDETLSDGKILLVAQHEPLFRVKSVEQKERVEPVAFKTQIVKDPRFPVGYLVTVSEGENGERTIVSEIEYADGVKVSETILSEKITKEPVQKEIILGSRREDGSGDISVATGNLIWPTGAGYSISRGFSATHFGEDIAAKYGTPIFAADNGVVTVSQATDVGYGLYIVIDHQNGMQTVYGHNSELLVHVGETVTQGQIIALMGSTGNSSGNHLHFEVRVQGIKVDPELYLYG